MIVEMRTYKIKPGAIAEYYRIYETEGLAIQRRILGNLIGYFHTDIGPLNQIVHLWGYEDLADRAARRVELAKSAEWLACVARLMDLIIEQDSKILLGAPFSPIR